MNDTKGIGRGVSELEDYLKEPVALLEAMQRVIPNSVVERAERETRKPDVKSRCRKLPSVMTFWMLVMTVLKSDTGQGNIFSGVLHHRLFDAFWKGVAPCGKAFAKAKDRVNPDMLRLLFELLRDIWLKQTKGLCFYGFRVMALDGTCGKTPDTACCRKTFGALKASRGRTAFPQGRGLALVCCGTRLVVEQAFGVYKESELALFDKMPKAAFKGSLVLMDRGFPDWVLLGAILDAGGQFLVRLPKCRVWKEVEQTSAFGWLVDIAAPQGKKGSRRLRLLKYRVREIGVNGGKDEEIWLLTSLTDKRVADLDLCRLYHQRWGVETVFDEIKTHLLKCCTVNRPVMFRGKTPERVRKEWLALLITYNALRMLMCEAAQKHPEACKGDPLRLSFTATAEMTRNAVRDMGRDITEKLPGIYKRLLKEIAGNVVPARHGRHVVRAVKVKMSRYACKRGIEQEADYDSSIP